MGIVITSEFDVNAALPIDSRMTAVDQTARDAIDPGVRYEGMTVYVEGDLKTYQLQGGITNSDWVEYGAGSSTVIQTDVFDGTGSQTDFTLTSDPGGIDNLMVYIFGVYQQKATYSISTTTLTFSTAPPTGTDNIEVKYGIALNVGAPSNGSVTQLKMAARDTVPGATAGVGEIAISGSSGNFSTTSITRVDVTNLSVTITTVGRPVRLELVNDGVYNSRISCSDNGSSSGVIGFVRDSTSLPPIRFALTIAATGLGYCELILPVSSFSITDFVSAGTYTYKVQASEGSGSGVYETLVHYCKLIAYEI